MKKNKILFHNDSTPDATVQVVSPFNLFTRFSP